MHHKLCRDPSKPQGALFTASVLGAFSQECALLQGPMKLMADGYKSYGEVFTVPVLHKNFTFLLGPHVSGHFFKANDDEMSQKEVGHSSLHGKSEIEQHDPCLCSWWMQREALLGIVQVYEFNVPTFGKGVVFDVDHKVCILDKHWCGQRFPNLDAISSKGVIADAEVMSCRSELNNSDSLLRHSSLQS